MNLLIYLTIIVFICFYIQGYLQASKEIQIIQTTLSSFKPSLLYEKNPIYIYDRIVNPADLFNTIFKYQYMYHILSLSNENFVKKNMSRYVVIYNDSDDVVDVTLIHPSNNKSITYFNANLQKKNYKVSKNPSDALQKVPNIKVILKPNNTLILPINWTYHTAQNNILEIHLFDMMSTMYSFIT
jgi:hypothetical protein